MHLNIHIRSIILTCADLAVWIPPAPQAKRGKNPPLASLTR